MIQELEPSPLPPGWAQTDLGSLTSEARPGFKCGERDASGFAQLRMNNIGLSGALVLDTILRVPRARTDIEAYRLQKGDVLFNNTNTAKLVGKTALFAGELRDCVYSNHITRLRVSRGLVDPSLLAWFLVLQQQVGTFERTCHRSVNQATVSGRELLRLQVPLPPFEEQLRLTSRVGYLLGELRKARQALERVRTALDPIRHSLLTSACTGNLTDRIRNLAPSPTTLDVVGNGCREKGDEGLVRNGGAHLEEADFASPTDLDSVSDIPGSWALVRLAALAELRRGKAVEHDSGKGSVQVYGGNGLAGRHSQSLVDDPTVVIGRVGSNCGNVHLTTGPAWVTDNALFTRWVNPAISVEFLALCLRQRRINELSGGTGQPYLSKDLLYHMLIPVPPAAEQAQVVRKVGHLLAILSRVEGAADRGIRRSSELERDILSTAFRGQLVSQDPDDEPASSLLKRLGSRRGQMGETNSGSK